MDSTLKEALQLILANQVHIMNALGEVCPEHRDHLVTAAGNTCRSIESLDKL